jgi:hypothetical protein
MDNQDHSQCCDRNRAKQLDLSRQHEITHLSDLLKHEQAKTPNISLAEYFVPCRRCCHMFLVSDLDYFDGLAHVTCPRPECAADLVITREAVYQYRCEADEDVTELVKSAGIKLD